MVIGRDGSHGRVGRDAERAMVARALRRVPLFESLSDGQIDELTRVARRQRFDRDQIVFYQGDCGDTFYVVLAGQVKVSVSSPDGQEAILVILDDGESFGELALLDDQPRSATIEATRPTEVLALRKSDFHRLLGQHPEISIALLRVMTKRLRDTDQLVQDAAFLDVAERLAKKLLLLLESHGRRTERGWELDIHLTQQDLAAMIGATRESVNKQLGVFRDRGILVVDRQRITIVDRDALRERVEAAGI
ncbi:MAG: Crp/Fnr family transcriptional regulator [Chloroflexi bacterium]|nr:Crp/Fnr family transcriptional regulator [Chloroflexota bacterium]